MSFFANLLGGTLQGVGAGMSAVAADEEKLQAQRALLQDKQQERAAERQWQQEQMAARLAGSGAGSGSRGFNLMEEAARARTPEQRQDLINSVRAVDENAGLRLADVGFGMPVMNAVAPTAGDFARYDRAGDMGAAPPTTALERAAYDREKGAQALQRLYTLFLDPGKLEAHARGERQFGLNDLGTGNAAQTPQRGGSLPEAPAAFRWNPGSGMDDAENSQSQQDTGEVPGKRAGVQAGTEGRRNALAEARALDRQIADAYVARDAARPGDKVDHRKRVDLLEARRDALDGAALAPALNNYQPDTTVRGPSPTAVLPNALVSAGAGRYAPPKSLADAWRAKVGAGGK